MTQERMECPFCSESIVRGALKCRFCREWLSTPEPVVNKNYSTEEIRRAKPHLGALEDVRAGYLATMQSREGRSRPTKSIEPRARGLPDRRDGHTDSTVEAPEPAESGLRTYWATIEDIPQDAELVDGAQDHDSGLSDRDNEGDGKQDEAGASVKASPARTGTEASAKSTLDSDPFCEETGTDKTQPEGDSIPEGDESLAGEQRKLEKAVGVSPAPVWAEFSSAKKRKSKHVYRGTLIEKIQRGVVGLPDGDAAAVGEQHRGKRAVEVSSVQKAEEVGAAGTIESGTVRKRTRIPWLRTLMLLSYLGISVALAMSESASHSILRDARTKEGTQEYDAAADVYLSILDDHPFSFAAIEAANSLRRMCQSEVFDMPEPSWGGPIKSLLGSDVDPIDVHLLPLIAWPASAILLLLVFVTRIFRPGVAFLALLLMAVAGAGSVAQFAWYGSISLPPVAEVVQESQQATPAVYFATYFLLVLTALMTLTATRKRLSAHVEKREDVWRQL